MAEAVANSVKETTNDFVASVQETDWKSELSVFGKTVQQETVDLGVKTVRAVEALPEVNHCYWTCFLFQVTVNLLFVM